MARRPLTQADRDRVRELHAAGRNRNQIAKDIDRSGATVSKLAAELGLSFDREQVKAATDAKVADAREKRSQLMLDYLTDAQRLRQQLWGATEYREHGGRDFVCRKWTQPEPTPADKLKLMQASATAAASSLKLDHHDADRGADGAKSMLGALAAGLQAAYDQLEHEDQADDDDRSR